MRVQGRDSDRPRRRAVGNSEPWNLLMADHTTEIARIRELLRSGAKSVTVDGVTTTIDTAELKRQLRELINDDDASVGNRRPFAQGVYLGGF